MFDNYRIVAVTPAGRRRYLEILIPQILALRPYIDEYRLWVNTTDAHDIAYMEAVAAKYSDFIKLERLPQSVPVNGNLTIRHFFPQCCDPNTIYVRFDDDIVFIDSVSAFRDFLIFRIVNPHYFLVYANILNNAVTTHIHQCMGNLKPVNKEVASFKAEDPIGWGSPQFAVGIHEQIIKEITKTNALTLHAFHWKTPWILYGAPRVSINCISWFGSQFAQFGGIIGHQDEEYWLSVIAPRELGRVNAIYGGFVVVHFAFCTQRALLEETTDYLQQYKEYTVGKKYNRLL
jgi:hypothetical protein